ncbi:MAG: 3-hydroxyacyl-CoA dehydrogenase NAD-binding protein [Thermomicrobiales bacterium]|nr:3-hydroxyacyl-CoA dehydrogenase NAD-binding protein [Thermomicrobiales bacterium]
MASQTGPGDDGGRELNTAAVIGAGTMGRQIAALIAGSGRLVRVWDADPAMLAAARERIATETRTLPDLPRYAHHQFRLEPPADLEALLTRIVVADSLADSVLGADIVIEAVRENLDTKLALFTELSRLAPEPILTTNSSSLPSSQIAPAVEDPGRFLNTHFFAPVWSRPMVELMGSGATRPEVMAAAERFGKSLGLVTAVVRGDSKGFIINRVWRAVKRESLRVVDEEHADPADVDRLWMLFFGTPYGPFGIMDMVGLDVVADIETSYQKVATDPSDQPSAVLHEKLAEGDLGEKSGRGFYTHPDPEYTRASWLTGDEGHEG